MKSRFLIFIMVFNSFITNAQPIKFEWVNAFECIGTMSECFTTDLLTDNKNNLITTGLFSEIVDFNPSASAQYLLSVKDFMDADGFMSKLDKDGKFLWTNHFSGPNYDYISKIEIDSLNNIYALGVFGDSLKIFAGKDSFSFYNPGYANFLLKMNEKGELLWFKHFDSNCRANSMNMSPDGSIVVTGSFLMSCNFSLSSSKTELTAVGSEDIFIAKYDTTASLKWVKSFGSPSREYATIVKLDTEGNILINGLFNGVVDFDASSKTALYSAVDSDEIFIAKYDSSGSFQWTKQWKGALYNPNAGTLSIDSKGNIISSRMFINSIDLDPNSGIVNIKSSDSALDSYVLKLSPKGDYLWHKHISSTATFHISSLSIGVNDNLYFGGSFERIAYLDFGKDTINLTSSSIIDGYYAVLDSSGKYLFKTRLAEDIHKINATKNNDLYIRGTFYGTIDFDPSPKEFLFTASYLNNDDFCLKLTQTPLSIKQYNSHNDIKIYPNPTNQFIYFEKEQNVKLINMLGEVVYEGDNIKEIDLSQMTAGVYILKVINNGKTEYKTHKIVKL